MKHLIILTIGLTLAPALDRPAWPVTPAIWRDDTFEEFEKGDPDGVSVSAEGNLTLSPGLEEYLDTKEMHVWSMVRDGKGNLYVGTGNQGRIIRIGPDRKAVLIGSLPNAKMVHALALDPTGRLYAGSSPEGAIYRIGPGESPALVCSTGTSYVWALALAPDGQLYAATGGGGKILRVSAEGRITEIGATSDEHVVSLAAGSDGALYAGTEGNGLVYRIQPGGRAQVLYDAPEREVRALAVSAGGAVYAGGMSGASRLERGTQAQERPAQGGPTKNEGSSVYRISPSGAAAKLWESTQPLLFCLLPGRDGELLVATGDRGLLYRLGEEGSPEILARFEEGLPLVLCPGEGGEVFVGAGASGKIYRISGGASPQGTFTSRRYDFGTGARWGKIAWRAETPEGTEVVLQTRSGNVEKSDDGWSDWSPELRDGMGSQIPSSAGRFLQYRARLRSKAPGVSPTLREVAAAGLPENLRPSIQSLEVIPPGRPLREGSAKAGAEGAPTQRPAPPPASGQPGFRIQWTARDPNNDDLSFALYVRGIEESRWRVLKEDLRTTSYTWEAESIPDGTTLIKLVASDLPGNPESLALTAERLCEPFDVDNTPPRVTSTNAIPRGGDAVRVEGEAADQTSPLRRADYAVDSGDWKAFFPADGIFDSLSERFEFKVEGLSPGDHTILVRVFDALENVGVGKVLVRVGGER